MQAKGKDIEADSYDKNEYTFEEAIRLTGFGKYNAWLVVTIGLVVMGVSTEYLGMSAIIPSAQCDFHLTTSDKGLLSATGFTGAIIGSPIWGYIADKHGRRNIMLVTLYLAFVSTLLASLSSSLWLFTTLRFISGFLLAAPYSICSVFIGEYHSDKYRSKVITWAHVFTGIANSYIPVMSWLFIPMNWQVEISFLDLQFKPWRMLLILCGLPGLVAAILLSFMSETPRYLLSKEKSSESLEILKKIYHYNTSRPKESFPVKHLIRAETGDELEDSNKKSIVDMARTLWHNLRPILYGMQGLRTLTLCALNFLTLFMATGFFMWFPDVLNQRTQYAKEFPDQEHRVCTALNYKYAGTRLEEQEDEVESETCSDHVNTYVYKIVLMMTCIQAIVYFLIGSFINYIGKKPLLVIFYVVTAAAGIGLSFAEAEWLAIFLFLNFLSCSCCLAVITSVTVDAYSTHHRAMALAVTVVAGKFGAIAGVNTVGNLFAIDCYLTFGIFSAVSVVCFAITLTLPSAKRKEKVGSMEQIIEYDSQIEKF